MNRKKLPVALLLLLLLVVLSGYAAYNIHFLLSREPGKLTAQITLILHGLATIPKVRLLFLFLLCISLLFLFWLVTDHHGIEYRSEEQEVIPGILKTPKAAGQGQYGTACWLSPSAQEKAFQPVMVDLRSDRLRALMEQGRADLEGKEDG